MSIPSNAESDRVKASLSARHIVLIAFGATRQQLRPSPVHFFTLQLFEFGITSESVVESPVACALSLKPSAIVCSKRPGG